jgi:hypothetical protein
LLDIVQILCEPAYPMDDAPRDRRIQPCQIARRRVQDPDLVHGLFQPQLPNNFIEWLAVLPARDLLPLAHERFRTSLRIARPSSGSPSISSNVRSTVASTTVSSISLNSD